MARARSAPARVEYDFHVASRGFGVVPSVVVAAVIIVIIIIRMDHEHPRRDINIIPGVPGDADDLATGLFNPDNSSTETLGSTRNL